MPATTKVPLGASTLNRKWYLDVNTGTHAAPTWIGVFGVEDLKPDFTPTVQPDDDYDSEGYKSSTVTAVAWGLTLKLARKVQASSATTYDPGQEVLRAASPHMGAANRVEVRWYEMEPSGPRVEAYQGYAAVSWSDDGGAMDANSTVSVVLTGQGARTSITHPDGAFAAPVIYSITPSTVAAAGGTLVHVIGTNFFKAGVNDVVATTGVCLVAHNFTSWVVENNNSIWGITPAETAGASYIKVTNSAGASNIDIVVTAV